MPKVVFILCPGHSGSTLLDLLAGTIPGVFSAGELCHLSYQLHRRGREPERVTAAEALKNQDVCTCLHSFWSCPIWSRVIDRLSARLNRDLHKRPMDLKLAVLTHDRHEAHRSTLRGVGEIFTVKMPRMLFNLSGHFDGAMPALESFFYKRYSKAIAHTWALYETMAEVTGASWIVDSSKDWKRMLLLRRRYPENTKIILLIRDIRGVAYSAMKLKRDPVYMARQCAKQYTQIWSALTGFDEDQLYIVSYESLAQHPVQMRNDICKFLGFKELLDPLSIDTTQHHLVAGNPMRYRGQITIRYDDGWQTGLTHDSLGQIEKIEASLPAALRVKNNSNPLCN